MISRASGQGCGDGSSSSFRLPANLTVAGRQAFAGAVQAYATQLTEQLLQQRRRPEAVHTTHDVQEAKQAYEQRLREQDDEAFGVRAIAITLLVVAAGLAGLATMYAGFAQATLLGLAVGTEAAGLLLVWRSRPRDPA